MTAIPPPRDPAPDVSALEHAWMRAWRERDRSTLERVLADDFVLTSATGEVIDRARWLELATGRFVCEEFVWRELRVRPLGAARDVAVVHGRSWQIARVDGRDWSGTFLITDVWVLRDGAWRVAARHGSGPIPPAAGQAAGEREE
jgi:Domain of unknown function (DUF4440)